MNKSTYMSVEDRAGHCAWALTHGSIQHNALSAAKRHGRLFLVLCLALGWPLIAHPATNLDVPINLDTTEYRVLAKTRKASGEQAAAMETGLASINRLWGELGKATAKAERIRIIGTLTTHLGSERDRARKFQRRQDDIRIQALKTLDKSGVRNESDVAPADYAAFKDVAVYFGDEVFAQLDKQTQTATSNLVAVNRMLTGLRKVRRELATSSLVGISSARDLFRITQNAELNMLAGRSVERLMDMMLGGLRDLIVEEQEGELSNQRIHMQQGTLQAATTAAMQALRRPGGTAKDPASATPLGNPFRE